MGKTSLPKATVCRYSGTFFSSTLKPEIMVRADTTQHTVLILCSFR